jgi:hypothetical protein
MPFGLAFGLSIPFGTDNPRQRSAEMPMLPDFKTE